jgi:release factor glutamine methyltransferase
MVPGARIVAVDVSEAALRMARVNAARNQMVERVEFIRASNLEELPGSLPFDLIVSNPPYIPSRDIATLAPEVRDFDPRLALDGGDDGLAVFRQLAKDSLARLQPRGRLMLEFGDGQAASVRAILQAAGWVIEAVANDLSKRPRIVIAQRAEG